MPDVTQNVITKWRIQDRQAIAASIRMSKQMRWLAGTSARAAAAISRVGRALITPFGIGVGGFAAFGLVKHLVDVGREAEKAELNIAALLQQASRESNLPFKDFERAAAAAHTLRMRFRELAIESPATARNIRDAFEATTFFLSQAGINLEDQSKFARDIAVVEKQLGRAKGTVARDVRQILQGRGSIREIQTPVLQEIAKKTAKLAKTGHLAEAARIINEKLTPDPRLLEAYKDSFEGLTTTMGDNLRFLKEDAAKPILSFISGKLREWIKWLKDNKEEAKAFARAVGRGIVKAVKAVISVTKFLAKHWGAITKIISILVRVWLLAKMFSAIIAIIGIVKKLRIAFSLASLSAAGMLGPLGAVLTILVAIASFLPEIIDGIKRMSIAFVDMVKGFVFTGKLLDQINKALGVKKRIDLEGGLGLAARGKKILKEQERVSLTDPVDPTRKRFGGGKGKGKMRVRELFVDKMSARDRDFARLSTPAARVAPESFARRPLAGLGLAVATTGG